MTRRVATGDLFRLGRHRLVCGDSRDPAVLQRLAGRRRVGLLFASPPYYNQRDYCGWTDYPAYLAGMAATLAPALARLSAGGVAAWLVGRGSREHKDHVAYHSLLLEQQGLYFQDAIAWVKPQANYASRRSCHIRCNGFYYPAFRWETLLVYRKPGRLYRMDGVERDCMAQFHTDVWEIPKVTRQMRRLGHPSVCPSEIPRRCLLAYVARGGWVLDPFAGSGTTLVAAEATGRRALLVERKPEYCEIALRRWEDSSGREVERL